MHIYKMIKLYIAIRNRSILGCTFKWLKSSFSKVMEIFEDNILYWVLCAQSVPATEDIVLAFRKL